MAATGAAGSTSSAAEHSDSSEYLHVALGNLLKQAEKNVSVHTSLVGVQERKKLLEERRQLKKEETSLKRQRARLQNKAAAKLSSEELLQVLVIQSEREAQTKKGSASSNPSGNVAGENADTENAELAEDRVEIEA